MRSHQPPAPVPARQADAAPAPAPAPAPVRAIARARATAPASVPAPGQAEEDTSIIVNGTKKLSDETLGALRNELLASKKFAEFLDKANEPPEEILSMVAFLVDGDSDSRSEVISSISGLLIFNTRKVHRERKTDIRRRAVDKETATCQYISLKLYCHVKSRAVFDLLNKYGLVLSYQRVRLVVDLVVERCIEQHLIHEAIVPGRMVLGSFVIGANDNVDKTARSTTGDHFHGASQSAHQQPTTLCSGMEIVKPALSTKRTNGDHVKKLQELMAVPSEYTALPDVYFYNKHNCKPDAMFDCEEKLEKHKPEMKRWLNRMEMQTCIAFFSREKASIPERATISVLFPVKLDPPNTIAFQRYAVDALRKTTKVVNPGQEIIVMAADQPLYALLKRLQFALPTEYGLQSFFPLLGPLHVEQVLLTINAELARGTGVDSMLDTCDLSVQSAGAAVVGNPFITRARYLVQVQLTALDRIKQEAYAESGATDFEAWSDSNRATNDNFLYWSIVMDLQTLILLLVRSLREKDLRMYRACLAASVKYFFALDHHHYARWVPVHLTDWIQLEHDSPETYNELKKFFTISRTTRANSSMGVDQAHEQLNAQIKHMRGGLAFLGESMEESLLKWGVYAPEFIEMLERFEGEKSDLKPKKHHEDRPEFQSKFALDCNKVTDRMKSVFNPFSADNSKLCRLDNGDEIDQAEKIGSSIRSMISRGEEQFKVYVEERIVQQKVPITETLHKNAFVLPSNAKGFSDKDSKSSNAKDLKLIRSLKDLGPTRKDQILNALTFEPDDEPRVFHQNGEIYTSQKAKILPALQKIGATVGTVTCSAVIVDLSHVVHDVGGRSKGKTFGDLCAGVKDTLSYFLKIYDCHTVAVATDRYDIVNPLKTRHSSGSQYPVSMKGKVPNKLHEGFLSNRINKENLYKLMIPFLYESYRTSCDVMFSITYNFVTLSNMDSFPQSNHHEADYRMIQLISQCIQNGHKSFVVRTGDTDIIIILAGNFKVLSLLCPDLSIRVVLKAGKSIREFDIRKIACHIGMDLSNGLLMYHSFTGCDYTPHFYRIGKKKWLDLYLKDEDIQKVFSDLVKDPSTFGMPSMNKIVNFVKRGYGINGELSLTEDRYNSVMKTSTTTLRSLPPSPGAIMVQARKAIFVASLVWGSSLNPIVNYPAMSEYGWMQRNASEWTHIWTATKLPSPDPYVIALTKCGCKSSSSLCTSDRCSCRAVQNIPCSLLCACKGLCSVQG